MSNSFNKHQTFDLTDTVDGYERKLHINELKGKVTIVLRWRSRKNGKRHTQRTTLPIEVAREVAEQILVTSMFIAKDAR